MQIVAHCWVIINTLSQQIMIQYMHIYIYMHASWDCCKVLIKKDQTLVQLKTNPTLILFQISRDLFHKVLHSNQNFMKISSCYKFNTMHLVTTKFYIWYNSTAVGSCENFVMIWSMFQHICDYLGEVFRALVRHSPGHFIIISTVGR